LSARAFRLFHSDNLEVPTSNLPALPCYLNGEYTLLADAKISVMDRGFIFGDGVYEVLPVYAGVPFRFAQHMARLNRSLAELRIANPLSSDQWLAIIRCLVKDHAGSQEAGSAPAEQLIYIQISRGVAMRDHAMPTDIAPTVFVMCNAMKLPTAKQLSEGVACVTAEDFRWQKAHIKSTSLLGSVFARQISVDAGAQETIMFRNGFLSEAAASNVWVVKDGVLKGPPKDNLVLEGIRYGLIDEICKEQGVRIELGRIGRDQVFAADELLLSSATKEVLPVTRLDGKAVGNGWPGPVFAKLHAGYQVAKARSGSAS
jgi:D-alanine transaminase